MKEMPDVAIAPFVSLPDRLIVELSRRLRELYASVASLPAALAQPLEDAAMKMKVDQWVVVYTIDTSRRRVAVVDATPVEGVPRP